MTNTGKKKHILRRILVALLIVVLAAVGAVWALWHNEIATVMSMRQIMPRNDAHRDGSVYMMEVSGGYYFDDFLAQGGAENDAALIGFITGKITKGLIDMGISSPAIGCAGFLAQTEEGDWVFGRNYDFTMTNTMLVYTNPGNGRHASWSTVDLQFLGIDENSDVAGAMDRIRSLAAPYAPLDGVNDAGVACGIFMSYQGGDPVVATDQDTARPDLTSTTMLRLVLDYADTCEEAVELISQHDLHDSANTSFHYMIADATGRSCILEWVPAEGVTDAADNDGAARELRVIWLDEDPLSGTTQWQYVTNFIITPGYYADGDHQPGRDRYDHMGAALAEVGGVVADEQAAMDVLASIGRRTWNNDDGNGCTVHSAVYNLTDRTVLWVSNEHYGDPAYTLTLTVD